MARRFASARAVLPRRRIRQVKVVSFDDGVHNPSPGENVVQFITYCTLARA
jgi:hypothetical protein